MRHGVPASLLALSLLVPPVASLGAIPVHPTTDRRSADGPSNSNARALVQLVNEHRASLGLAPLTWSAEAAAVAQAHSDDMQRRDFFSHINPDHASPFDRIRAARLRYVHAGENIAYGYDSPRELFQAWLDSPGHRKNLENPNYTQHGLGSAGTLWTHVFLAPARGGPSHSAAKASTRRPARPVATPPGGDERVAAR
jgi:uncharacterized protein YkwD